MNRGDKIWHKVFKCPGVVNAKPRAHSEYVRLVLEGNTSPQYYHISDIQEVGADGKPIIREYRPIEPPEKLDAVVTPFAPAPESNVPVPAKADTYNGDLTLDRLLILRADIRSRLEALDESIAQVRCYALIRKSFESLKYQGEVEHRVQGSVDALRIKQDTQRALDAANRLAARGAL